MSGLDMALSGFSNLALRAKIRNDDGIDQLHHFVTSAILVAFAIITGFMEFASDPINCWNSGSYQWKHYQDHVNTYCWTHPMYPYPDPTNHSLMPYDLNSQGAADNSTQRLEAEQEDTLHFVHWASIFFLIQALLFKLPNLMWTEVNADQGSNVIKMVEMLQGALFAKPAERAETVRHLALFLEKWLRIHRKPKWFLATTEVSPLVKKTLSCCMVYMGKKLDLSTIYLVVKAFFLLNTLLQFGIVSAFLQLNFWCFGVRTLQAYEEANDVFRIDTTGVFPLVGLCHFETLDQQNPSGYWVQCILTIDLLLEKLFLVQWFWFLALLVLTAISLIVWCFKVLQTHSSLTLVQRYMKLMYAYSEPVDVPAHRSVEQFVTQYLRSDGVFILRILAVNTNEVIVAQLVEELWRRYLVFQDNADQDSWEDREPGGAKQAFSKDQ